MIGRPIRALLIANPALAALIGDRVSPIKFSQGVDLPGVMYLTDGMEPLGCRDGSGQYQGNVEISILATRYAEIEDIMTAIRAVLDNFSGQVAGWALNIDPAVEGPDDEDIELKAYYKRLDFYVTAEKL